MKHKKKLAAAAIIGATVGVVSLPQAIIGDLDWLDIMNLPKESAIRKAASSVGVGYQVKGNTRSRCNYASVGEKRVLANGHCIVGKDVSNIEVSFTDFEHNPVICDKYLASEAYDPSKKSLDYLLLECRTEIPDAISIDTRDLKINDPLIHIQHNCNYYPVGGDPQCSPVPKYDNSEDCKVFALNDNGNENDFTQGCDSLGGSSGSPIHSRILDESGNYPVVGLHHTGAFFADDSGSLAGKGVYNGVVKIGLVVDDLKKKGFDIMPKKEKVEEPKVSFWKALWQLIRSYF